MLWDRRLTESAVIWAAILVLIPAAISVYFLSRCGAWLVDGSRRCRHRRKGIGMRCGSHHGFNWYDVIGGGSFVLALAMLVAVLVLNQ